MPDCPAAPPPTDLTNSQWRLLEPLIPPARPGGRPACHTRRELLNAMLYWVRSGCAWRLLPDGLPPWQTVYHYWRLGRREGRWEQILTVLRHGWVDAGYRGAFLDWAREVAGIALLQVVVRCDGGRRHTWAPAGAPPVVPRFAVVPRGWVVERSFAWLGRSRRLSRDYEYLTEISESAIQLAMIQLRLRRLGS